MVVKDWIDEAVREIVRWHDWAIPMGMYPAEDAIAEILRKHCPMEDGVAYMPAPRCETCRDWEVGRADNPDREGWCALLDHDCDADFGCVEWEKRTGGE